MLKTLSSIIILCLLTSFLSAKIINVPADFSTIQSAINASSNGDTVIVSPGIYKENINFNGKNIVLSSNYMFDNNLSTISSTVIDGGNPGDPNLASCVMIVSGEDSTAVLQGFTLTNGKGSKWVDEHGAGTYREGGGILITLSSPTIKNNLIIDNQAVNSTGFSSAGGGGIRIGDGNPKIINNVIMRNKGLYGAGIVLNYTGGLIKNNIIYQNVGGEAFGGGGIWCYNKSNKGYKIIVENNTIVNNISMTDGGGLLVWETSVYAKNNIFWGNKSASLSKSIGKRTDGILNITYSDIEEEHDGTGNISINPMLDLSDKLKLLSPSPCIDAGDPDENYNDVEDQARTGYALFPSMGLLRNDIGAYGGKARTEVPGWTPIKKIVIMSNAINFKTVTVGDSGNAFVPIFNLGELPVRIDSIRIIKNPENFYLKNNYPLTVESLTPDTISIWWKPTKSGFLKDTLYIYHNDESVINPFKVKLVGTGSAPTLVTESKNIPNKFVLYQNYPNPFNPVTNIRFALPQAEFVELSVYDIIGNKIATLVKENLQAGEYSQSFDGINLASGIYIYTLKAGSFFKMAKMILIK